MSYDPQVWTDPAEDAAYSAARLNHMENGISDAHQLIADLQPAPTPPTPPPAASSAPGRHVVLGVDEGVGAGEGTHLTCTERQIHTTE